MIKIHWLTWLGLFLSLVTALVLIPLLPHTGVHQAASAPFLVNGGLLYYAGLGSFCLQIVSLYLLSSEKNALWLAVLASLVLLPLSCIFIIGCIISFNNAVFKGFTVHNDTATCQPGQNCFRIKNKIISALSMIIAGGLLLPFMFLMPIALVAAGLFELCCSLRIKNWYLFSIDDDGLWLLPSRFYYPIKVPYKQIEWAYWKAPCMFIGAMSVDGYELHIKLSLNQIQPPQRARARAALLSKLDEKVAGQPEKAASRSISLT